LSARDNAGVRVRALAATLNDAVVSGGRSLASVETGCADLPERDRPLARAMLMESLRWHHRYEWLLGRLVNRPLKHRDHRLAALLRIGLTQLDALRIPDHAAVSATVAAAPELGFEHARGLVNAVLRRFQRERESLHAAMLREPGPRYSHPDWLIAALERDWPEDWRSILEANNAPPPLWLRVNRQRGSRDRYLERLAAEGLQASPSEHAAAAVLMAEPCPVTRLPGFADGLVSVQDAAAQQAASLLEPGPGMRVLDACAAPGGKTAHILELCPDLGELVAIDSDAARLELVAANLDRLGLRATLIAADAARPREWFSGPAFDRILLDAPCSATGVIRRHPDIKLLRRDSDIAALADRQAELVGALWLLLKPGGRLLYVTCSVLPAENRRLIETWAASVADASLARFGSSEHFQILPGEANMDGFYYACLSKAGGGR
jgi:16S rRNA (cytosine967-C5)-methyltransferase